MSRFESFRPPVSDPYLAYAEGGVIWTPTELTTVTAPLSRQLEDPLIRRDEWLYQSQARSVVDHEYKRNVFLQARGNAQYAQFLQTEADHRPVSVSVAA